MEAIWAQGKVKHIQSVPLVIGQFLEPIDHRAGIIGSTTGSNYVSRILSTLDCELLKPSYCVALHRTLQCPCQYSTSRGQFIHSIADEKPDVAYQNLGGWTLRNRRSWMLPNFPSCTLTFTKRLVSTCHEMYCCTAHQVRQIFIIFI